MPRLPVLPARDIIKALGRAGFEVVGQRGSHIKLRRERRGEVRTVIVPNYNEVPRGVLVSILRQAGLSREEFLALL
jgi:predicted RNA binding protein YcfA (HicA-like mRNA interferase family)